MHYEKPYNMLYNFMNVKKTVLMYYNIYLFVAIAFKSMVIQLKLQWIIFIIIIMYYNSYLAIFLMLLYLKQSKTTYKYNNNIFILKQP